MSELLMKIFLKEKNCLILFIYICQIICNNVILQLNQNVHREVIYFLLD